MSLVQQTCKSHPAVNKNEIVLRNDVAVTRLAESDIESTGHIHSLAFPNQRNSAKWVAAKLAAFPATYSYTAKVGGEVVAGIMWSHKSGFREKAVIELEQIFVQPELQHQGIGTALILLSLEDVNQYIENEGFKINTLCVNTRKDNDALKLYQHTLGVEVAFELKGHTPNATEVFLAATNVDVKKILGRARVGG